MAAQGMWGALRGWLENRSSPANPDRWFIRHMGAEPASSGVHVDEDTALSATAVWAGVRIISETLAMLPLKLYERVDERSKRPARALGLYRVLHDEPNPEQTSFEFREMQQGFLLLWGNCYAQKIYNGKGEVSEMWPIVPWRVSVERSPTNAIMYRVRLPGDTGMDAMIPADDMLHIRGFSTNGLTGDNTVQRFRDSIGLSLAAEQFGGRFFGNGLAASGGLKFPGKLGPEGRKNVRESFREQHGGVSRAHRLMILEEGMEWFQMSTDPEKAQALETRKFQVTEVARILNLPPHLLKDLERATFTNIEHQGQEFVTYTMQPWLTRWEQRLNRSLLLPSQRSRYFTHFQVEGLLRGDSAARASFYGSMFNTGVYSINDIREKEDSEPVEGGDQRFVPLNMVPLDKVAELLDARARLRDANAPALLAPEPEPEPEPDPPEEPRAVQPDAYAALGPVVRAEAERVVKRRVNAMRGAMKRGPQDFRTWADGFFEKEAALMAGALTPALLSLHALTGDTVDVRALAALDVAASADEVRAALAAPEEFTARMDELLAAWEAGRAEEIARQIMDRPADTRAA